MPTVLNVTLGGGSRQYGKKDHPPHPTETLCCVLFTPPAPAAASATVRHRIPVSSSSSSPSSGQPSTAHLLPAGDTQVGEKRAHCAFNGRYLPMHGKMLSAGMNCRARTQMVPEGCTPLAYGSAKKSSWGHSTALNPTCFGKHSIKMATVFFVA